MRTLLLAILVICALLSSGVAVEGLPRARRSLLEIPSIDDVRTSCQTSAKTSVFVDSEGSANVRAHSSCQAFASSIDDIEEIVNDYVEKVDEKQEGRCTKVEVNEVIDACAQAIAKVYTEASVDIEVEGDAQACASASSEGDAYATAYSALLVNLWLGVTDGEDSAEAEAQVGSLNFALAKAWAEAKLSRCQFGTGEVEEFEESYAEQVRVAITCVTVELAAQLCEAAFKGEVEDGPCDTCGGGELESYLTETESTSEVGVCSSTYSLVDETEGNAATENREIVRCKGDFKQCCDEYYNDKSECLCGRGCNLKATASGLWLDETENKLCHCPNYDELPFDDPSEDSSGK